MPRGKKSRPLADRFWDFVDKENGPIHPTLGRCWVWTGWREKNPVANYGRIAIGGTGSRMIGAHRVSWMVNRGPIPAGKWVLHHCDRPPCVNPNHLFLGNQEANTADMLKKNRQRSLAGADNPTAKLTLEAIGKIKQRLSTGARQVDVAKEFGITQGHVSRVKRGVIWLTQTKPAHPRER